MLSTHQVAKKRLLDHRCVNTYVLTGLGPAIAHLSCELSSHFSITLHLGTSNKVTLYTRYIKKQRYAFETLISFTSVKFSTAKLLEEFVQKREKLVCRKIFITSVDTTN